MTTLSTSGFIELRARDDEVAKNYKEALLVVAPLPSPPWYDPVLIESVPDMLRRRGFVSRLACHLVPEEFNKIPRSLRTRNIVRSGIQRRFFKSVCVIGDMTTPEVRGVLAECRRSNIPLIDWSGETTLLRRYLSMLYNERV